MYCLLHLQKNNRSICDQKILLTAVRRYMDSDTIGALYINSGEIPIWFTQCEF
uniref:Uncharacterized protein n=1 Tax=Anguilla anguilla TaxID=7936 RepID=A0A0E9U8H1_ANGAN